MRSARVEGVMAARRSGKKAATKGAKKAAKKAVKAGASKPAGKVAPPKRARSSPSALRKANAAKGGAGASVVASRLIDARIGELPDWRGETLARMRRLLQEADPGVVEEWKWDVPVWSRDGILCTGEVYKGHVKLTFAKGAFLTDPTGLFNSSLEGNLRRAIDLHEGDAVDAVAFKDLVREAVALNAAKLRR